MTKNFIFAALALTLLTSFAKADDKECLVKRDGDIPLYAKSCIKKRSFYLVQTCDTNVICKANPKDVTVKPNVCKDSPSAPKFVDAYEKHNHPAIVIYLKNNPSVFKMQSDSGVSNKSLVNNIKKSNINQEVALITLSSEPIAAARDMDEGQAGAQLLTGKNPVVAQAFSQKNIKYLYVDNNGRSLSAYAIEKNKLVEIPLSEAHPSCNE